MPDTVQVPQPQTEPLSQQDLKLSYDALNDLYALSLLKETFSFYESDRAINHDGRWLGHDSLYLGHVKQKYWEGTKVPRASLPNQIVFDHVETAGPLISQAIFGYGPDWFQVWPDFGGTLEDARNIQLHMQYLFEHARYDNGGSAKAELRQSFQSVVQYGNGAIWIQWDALKRRPVYRWLDLRDLYLDPAARSSNIDECRSVVIQMKLSVDELDALRDSEGMKIPSKIMLYSLAQQTPTSRGEITKQTSEALRGVQHSPARTGRLPFPADQQIEVLIYLSRSRIIWALNRIHVAYNETNRWNFIPVAMAPCFPVLGRAYAQSYADVLEGPQRYGEAILNGHLDDMTLRLVPPRVLKRSALMSRADTTWAPGRVTLVGESGDMTALVPQPPATSIGESFTLIDQMGQRRTGLNAMSVAGLPTPSNANRTAAGISAQMRGPSLRVQPIVESIEEYLLLPLLYKTYLMLRAESTESLALPVVDASGQAGQVPSMSFRAPVQFRMVASSKMLGQERLMQILPFISQYTLNGPFIAALNRSGWTVDFMEFSKMIQDAGGTAHSYRLFRQMSQQETQALQQPSPESMMKMQLEQQSQQTRLAMGKMKADADIRSTMIQTGAKTAEVDEHSALEILKILQQQRQANKTGGLENAARNEGPTTRP